MSTATLSSTCPSFDPELESIQEFFQRFQCQASDLLHKFRNDDGRKASVLLRVLPVNIISDLQRRLAPTLLTDATYDEIHDHLLQQYSSSKSTIGASVQFLTCKQKPGQSLEDYARNLNSLASLCNYPSDCLDRLLRDIFVSGLISSAILSSLIQVCDTLTFRETLERAKLLETFRQDVDKIQSHHRSHLLVNATSDSSDTEVNKVVLHNKRSPKDNYLCYRCGSKGMHFSDECYARDRTCHICNIKGHIARICQKAQKHIANKSNNPCSSASHLSHRRNRQAHHTHAVLPCCCTQQTTHSDEANSLRDVAHSRTHTCTHTRSPASSRGLRSSPAPALTASASGVSPSSGIERNISIVDNANFSDSFLE